MAEFAAIPVQQQAVEMASLEFLRVTFGEVSPKERARVRKNLEDYCGLDTLGMVWIVEELRRLVGG